MFTRKLLTLLPLFIAGISTAHADFHSFEINELYSNADGTIQYIELFEAGGDDLAHFFATGGAEISSTDGSSTPTVLAFADMGVDLDTAFSTAGVSVLIATQYFADINISAGLAVPDYIMPDNFLFPGGGTLDFGLGRDEYMYGPLPGSDQALYASGFTGTGSPTNFAGVTGVVPVPAAVWLFGSGLIGLMGIARRKARA